MKFLIDVTGDGIPDDAAATKQEIAELIDYIKESLRSAALSVSVEILRKED